MISNLIQKVNFGVTKVKAFNSRPGMWFRITLPVRGGRICPLPPRLHYANSAPTNAKIAKILWEVSVYRSLSRAILVTLGQYLQGKKTQVSKKLTFFRKCMSPIFQL